MIFFSFELYSAHFPFVEYAGGRDVNITLQQTRVLEVIHFSWTVGGEKQSVWCNDKFKNPCIKYLV